MNAVRGGNHEVHAWSLTGATVTQLVADPAAFRLCCVDADACLEVVIEAPFTYRGVGAATTTLDPAYAPGLAPVLALIGKSVTTLEVCAGGELKITFSDGSRITVARRQDFESWNVGGRGSLSAIAYLCTPHPGPPWIQRVS